MHNPSNKHPFLAILLLPALVSTAQDVQIRKRAKAENPTLAITRFDGDSAIHTRLKQTLIQCDWFSVVSGNAATYRVAARHRRGSGEELSLRVSDASGATFDIGRTAPAGSVDKVIFTSVDALISKLFGVPGLCASRIAFAMGGRSAMKEVYLANFDGTGMTRVTHNSTISTEPS